MNELPVGTTFREAIYLASGISVDRDSIYESSPKEIIERKFSALKRRLRCTERPGLYPSFTISWVELKSPTPFPRSILSNLVQNAITTEGKH